MVRVLAFGYIRGTGRVVLKVDEDIARRLVARSGPAGTGWSGSSKTARSAALTGRSHVVLNPGQ